MTNSPATVPTTRATLPTSAARRDRVPEPLTDLVGAGRYPPCRPADGP